MQVRVQQAATGQAWAIATPKTWNYFAATKLFGCMQLFGFGGDGVPKSSKSRLCMRLCTMTMTIRLYQCFDMP